AAVHEPGGRELSRSEAFLARLSRQRLAARREAEPVLVADLLAEGAARQVLACRCAGCGIPEVALVEARGLLEQCEQALAPAPLRVLLRRRLVVLEGHPVALGEPFDRLREVELHGLANERDQVAALAAAEAVEELLDRVDG